MRRSLPQYLFFGLILAQAAFGGITGKIAGNVVDAETARGLAGANVFLLGTDMGAASDENGYYVILNVPPGTYTLRASMIGYENVEVTQVEVATDLTTTINLSLSTTVLGGGEVTVVAQRPVVTPDVSASQAIIRRETIERLPVANLTQVIGLQAGIQGITIRGSSAYQTAFMVDGFSLNDARGNQPFTAVSLSSIQEVRVQTGGFNAEYGDVRSGVISVVTKEGDRDHYSGVATVRYSPPAPKHFGSSIYSPDTYFTRPYLDPEVCWTGTDNGSWDEYLQDSYIRFSGFNALSAATLKDDDPDNDMTPAALQRLYEWEHRRQGDIVIPDYTIDMGVGGPVPLIGKKLGDLRFFLSYRAEQDAFLYPLSRDSYSEEMVQLKVTSNIGRSMKLSVNGFYGEIRSVSSATWLDPPSGDDYLRSDYGLATRVEGGFPNSVLYVPGYYSPMAKDRVTLGATFNHVLSNRAYYNLSVQWSRNNYHADRTADRDTLLYEIVPGVKADEAPWGYYGLSYTSMTDGILRMGGWMGLARDRSVTTTTILSGDFTSQVTPTHQFKTGFKVVYNDFRIHSALVSPFSVFWNHTLDWERSPYQVGAYIQDKIEISEFIANVGLRFDYDDPSGTWYILESYDPFYTASLGNTIEGAAPVVASPAKFYISPRLGVSHPITVNSKLYFNYGHNRQQVPNAYLYRLNREGTGAVYRIGDPNLEQSKTVAYELGFERNLLDQYLFKLAGYYKDVIGQPSWTGYTSADLKVKYYLATMDNYEDIRGLEITLEKRRGRWLRGFINYTYMVNTEGYFGLRNYYQDPNRQREELAINPYQEKPHPRPYLRANLDLQLPQEFGPHILGFFPFGGWSANVLGDWQAGSYFTFNPGNLPGIQDNMQWKNSYNVDLRLSKRVQSGKYDMEVFLDVTNVFNFKIFSPAGFIDGNDRTAYMESLHLPSEEEFLHGADRPGDVRKHGVKFAPMEAMGSPSDIGNPVSRVIYYSRNGEGFTDGNGNDVWDAGEDYVDINGNGSYDGSGTYWQHGEGGWELVGDTYLQRVLDNKAYIDMPNLTYFTFLNPRDITLGVKISF